MELWNGLTDRSNKPEWGQLNSFVDNPLWQQLCGFVEETYGADPVMEYSCCSMQRGWNVKYKKGGKSICTLYPEKGHFTCLVMSGGRQTGETELLLTAATPYVRKLYEDTRPFNGSRWLMIEVTDEQILEDVKTLVLLRTPCKKAAKA